MNIFEYLNLYTSFFIHEDEGIHLNIKTNLAAFPNAFLSFRKQEPKKETKKSLSRRYQYIIIYKIYPYMFTFPSFFCKITVQPVLGIIKS